MSISLAVALTLGLVLVNAFFVAAEFAIVRLRATQIHGMAREHGLRGRILARIYRNLDAYLSACQLGVTLASLALGWIGEPAVSVFIEPLLTGIGVTSPAIVQGFSFAIAFFLISYLHIVVGEQAPKMMAIQRAEPVSLWTSIPLFAFYWLMWPLIWLINASSRRVLRLMGGAGGHVEAAHSSEELKMIVRSSHSHGELDPREGELISRALEFGELTAGDLMRPAAEMICLFTDKSPQQNLAIMQQHRYTRYPLCDEDYSHVLGIVHIKDIFAAREKGEGLPDLRGIARPASFIPRDLPAFELLQRFQAGESHFMIVVDDLGTVTGFLTLDHVLESLLGQIQDEFKHQKTGWRRLPDGSLLGPASMPLYTVERELRIELPDQHADTLGGLVMWRLERLPKPGERIAFDDFDVVVREMRGPRILRVQLYPKAVS